MKLKRKIFILLKTVEFINQIFMMLITTITFVNMPKSIFGIATNGDCTMKHKQFENDNQIQF